MRTERAPTDFVRIYLAGDIEQARQSCRQFCYGEGFCVTVTATTYIYTGGEELGICVECINYPRFPTTGKALWEKASRLADKLRTDLCQHSALVMSPVWTEWRTSREDQ